MNQSECYINTMLYNGGMSAKVCTSEYKYSLINSTTCDGSLFL